MEFPFEKARWIACTDCPADTAPVFRAAFSGEKGKETVLWLCGVGFEYVELNGKPMEEELLNPAFSRYDKTVYYHALSLTDKVRDGANTLEITLGNGWYNQQEADAWQFEHAIWKDIPRLLCAVYAGDECILASGSHWQCAPSGTVYNSLRCGETYDAGIVPDGWHDAQVMPPPGGVLKRTEMEPIRVRREYEPVAIVPSAMPTIFDFGINLSGNVEITVEGKRGSRVVIYYSELVTENGFIARERAAEHVYAKRFQQDVYILRGEGQETWHSKFGYNGFRYADVCLEGECKLLSVRARQFHTDLRDAGGIETEDESITRIQSAIRQSTLTNFHHMPTDCPHREKNGWTGDAWLSAEQLLFNFDGKKAYEKWLEDILDAQRPSGQIPGIVPTSAWGYAWGSGVTWDMVLFELPWQLYRFYGEEKMLRRCAPAMKQYLVYLEDTLDDGVPCMGLGDWTAPPETETLPEPALRTAMAVYVGLVAEQIAAVIGDEQLGAKGKAIEERCKAAFHCHYDTLSDGNCQLFFALRLLFGMSEDEDADKAGLLRSIEKTNGHLMGGIFTAKYVPEALCRFGLFHAAWKLVSAKGYPGWDDLAKKCAGTLGENWFGGSSMNHHMYSCVGAWYYRYLAGITIEKPGFAAVRISPRMPGDLGSFRAWHDTPLGRLSVAWDETCVAVEIPAGMEAVLELDGKETVLKSGRNTVGRTK